MAFYSERPVIAELIFIENKPVKIMKTWCGATCCLVDHTPEERQCLICGTPITPHAAYFPMVSEQQLLLYAETIEDAKDLAAKWLADERPDERQPPMLPPPPSQPPGTPQKGPPKHASRRDEIYAQAKKLEWGKKLMALLQGDEKKLTGRQRPKRPKVPQRH